MESALLQNPSARTNHTASVFYISKCMWTKINQQLGLQHSLLRRENPSTSSPSPPDKQVGRLLENFVCKFLGDSEGVPGSCNTAKTVQEQILPLYKCG